MRVLRFSSRICVLVSTIALLSISGVDAAEQPKRVIGWLENVRVGEAGMDFRAKIDTGADSSAIHAEDIRPFFRKGDTWIRFRLTNWQGKRVVLERKLERYTKIKRKLALSIKRPVVKLSLCLAGIEHFGDVSLADRKNFKYQLLVGRSYLTGHFLVDPEKTYLTKPVCPVDSETKGGSR